MARLRRPRRLAAQCWSDDVDRGLFVPPAFTGGDVAGATSYQLDLFLHVR